MVKINKIYCDQLIMFKTMRLIRLIYIMICSVIRRPFGMVIWFLI